MDTSVSVIIPTYNGTRFLPQAVESALGQTRPPQEVIVIDDGSTEDTAAALAPFHGRVTYVRQPNRGVAAARNHGIRIATGRYICLLDHDDVCAPDRLEKQVGALHSEPSAIACFCGHWTFNDRGRLKHHAGNVGASALDPIVHLSRYLVFGPTVVFDRRRADGLSYPEDVPCVDDHIFVALLRTRGPFAILADQLYGYRQSERQTSKVRADLCSAGAFDLRLSWLRAHWPTYWPERSGRDVERVMWDGLASQVAANYWARNRAYFLHDRTFLRQRWPRDLPLPPEAHWRWYPGWLWRLRGWCGSLLARCRRRQAGQPCGA
jgi:glycosyltransferase involved in cell wall biosynthesis